MPVYKYTALSASGQTVRGSETASSYTEMVSRLRERQQYPVSIEDVVARSDVKDIPMFNRVGVKQIALFARQFAAMLRAGVSIVNTLDILRQQTEHKRLRETVDKLYEDVQKGYSFSETLNHHQNVFPSLMINMVAAGEASGNLDGVTQRIATHYEKEFKVNNKVRSAMVYPMILSVLIVVVVIFMLTFIMPTFLNLFEGSGVPLPGVTRLLLNMTKTLQDYWYILLAVVALAVYMLRRYSTSAEGRRVFDSFRLRMPVFRSLTAKATSARFCRTLSTLLASGIPLLQALENTASAVGNVVVGEAIMDAREDVRRGIALSMPIRRSGMFPPMVDSMIKIGEESGALDDLLEKAADFFDEEVETEVQRLLTFIEPALIVAMAVIVGFIVIAMLLPMFDMLKTIQ